MINRNDVISSWPEFPSVSLYIREFPSVSLCMTSSGIYLPLCFIMPLTKNKLIRTVLTVKISRVEIWSTTNIVAYVQ